MTDQEPNTLESLQHRIRQAEEDDQWYTEKAEKAREKMRKVQEDAERAHNTSDAHNKLNGQTSQERRKVSQHFQEIAERHDRAAKRCQQEDKLLRLYLISTKAPT